MQLAFGVRIRMLGVIYSNPSIGLYNDGTDSYFRWITQSATNTTDAWLSGVLLKNWISGISKSIDLRRSGGVAIISGGSINISNTDKFWNTIENLGINLQGYRIEVVEIDLDTPHGSANANETLLFTGVCNQPQYNTGRYTISFKNAFEERNSNLSKLIESNTETDPYTGAGIVEGDNQGKAIPVSFGTSAKKKFSSVANRIENIETQFVTEFNNAEAQYYTHSYNQQNKELNLYVSLNNLLESAYLTVLQPRIDNEELYVKIIRGNGTGEVRRVLSVDGYAGSTNTNIYTYTLDQSFIEAPSSVSDDTQTWVQAFYMDKTYYQDFWPCDSLGVENVYTSENSEFSLIPSYVFNGGVNSENNRIVFAPVSVTDDFNKVEGFFLDTLSLGANYNGIDTSLIFDYTNTPIRYTDNSLSVWSIIGGTDLSITQTNPTGWESDKNPLIYNQNQALLKNVGGCLMEVPYRFLTPKLSTEYTSIDSIYLLVDLNIGNSQGRNNNDRFRASLRGWAGYASPSIDLELNGSGAVIGGGNAQNIPDFWYNDSSDNFYPNINAGFQVKGYTLFDLGVGSISEFNGFDHLFLSYGSDVSSNTQALTLKFKQALIGVKVTNDIKEGLFASGSGRVWGRMAPDLSGLVSPTGDLGLIQTPIDVLLHSKVLMNFGQEKGINAPSDGWGYDYAVNDAGTSIIGLSGLPINTALEGVGSFYNSDLAEWGNLFVNAQITDKSEADVTRMSENLSKGFWLATWINSRGEESVGQFTRKASETPTKLITLNEIVPNSLNGKRETDSRDIFSMPFLRYGKNALGGFDSSIEITLASSDLTTESEQAGAVKGANGLTDAEKAELWQRSRALYLKYGTLNTPPTELTDHKWITRDQDALWYMREWFRNMGAIVENGIVVLAPREYISFSVPYQEAREDSDGNPWDLGTHLLVNFPNETNAINREIMITSIKYELKEAPIVKIEGLMYSEKTADNIIVVDTYTNSTVWEDEYVTGDLKEDIL